MYICISNKAKQKPNSMTANHITIGTIIRIKHTNIDATAKVVRLTKTRIVLSTGGFYGKVMFQEMLNDKQAFILE